MLDGRGEVETCLKYQVCCMTLSEFGRQYPQQNTVRLHCKGVPHSVYHDEAMKCGFWTMISVTHMPDW